MKDEMLDSINPKTKSFKGDYIHSRAAHTGSFGRKIPMDAPQEKTKEELKKVDEIYHGRYFKKHEIIWIALFFIGILTLSILSMCTESHGNSLSMNINAKVLEEAAEPVDRPIEVGITGTVGYTTMRAYYLVGKGLYSYDLAPTDGLRVIEIDLGVRYFFNIRGVHPYISGGPCSVHSQVVSKTNIGKVRDSNQGVGLWADAGLAVPLSKRVFVGIETQYTWVEMKLLDKRINPAGLHVGMTIGFKFK